MTESPHKLRTFKQLTEDQKLAVIRTSSDKAAQDAARARKVNEAIVSAITEDKPTFRSIGAPREKVRKEKPNPWITLQVSQPVIDAVNTIAKEWEINRSSTIRFAIDLLARTYGFKAEILTKGDRKALQRSEVYKKPLRKSQIDS